MPQYLSSPLIVLSLFAVAWQSYVILLFLGVIR